MRTTGSGHNWLGDANHINSAYRVDSSNCKLSIRAFTRDGAEAFFVPEEFQERVTCRDGNSGVQLVNYNLETDEVFISNSNFGNCNPPTPTE
ncbi:MAG: hypothetical protein HAW66_09955, partial [Shewanella sp.]|nr:hypothetical protein [Shewanella sp.]